LRVFTVVLSQRVESLTMPVRFVLIRATLLMICLSSRTLVTIQSK